MLALVLTGLFLLTAGTAYSQFAELEKKYGPEYFFAIQGEVAGQAAPGVQAVYINGRQVVVNKDLTFGARVTLKEGEKYLSIETRYKGLYFTKKFLVIRHPSAPKTFKLNVPQEVFKQIVSKPKLTKKKHKLKRHLLKKVFLPPKPKPIISYGYKASEFVKRFNHNALIKAIKADNYGYAFTSPENSLKWLNELLRQPDFYDRWKRSAAASKRQVILSPTIIRLIKETAGYRFKPFAKLTKEQQQKIIKLNRLLLEAIYPLLSPKSLMATTTDKWLGFEFVAELEPNRLLIVRHIESKYFASIYEAKSKAWIPLAEINHQELVDLLEEGTIPVFIGPVR